MTCQICLGVQAIANWLMGNSTKINCFSNQKIRNKPHSQSHVENLIGEKSSWSKGDGMVSDYQFSSKIPCTQINCKHIEHWKFNDSYQIIVYGMCFLSEILITENCYNECGTCKSPIRTQFPLNLWCYLVDTIGWLVVRSVGRCMWIYCMFVCYRSWYMYNKRS